MTLRPLVRKLSASLHSWAGETPDDDGPAGPKPPSLLRIIRRRPIEQRGLSILDDSTLSKSCSTDTTSSSKSDDVSAEKDLSTMATQRSNASRWWRRDWWKPPSFKAGLMTEFDRGLRVGDVEQNVVDAGMHANE